MKRMMVMSLLAGVLCCASACSSEKKAEDSDQNTTDNQTTVSPGQENMAANEAPTNSNPDAGRETNVENSDASMPAGDGNTSTGSMTAEDFVKEAASGGMMEVELGKLASQKAQNAQVKEFGQMMVKDHTKANEQLKSIVTKKNMTLPAKMMEKHQKHVSEMTKLSGSEFDTHYMSMMVTDHQEDISKFQQASKNVSDAEIKNFASATLPTLQMHLEKAQQINSSLEGGTAKADKQ